MNRINLKSIIVTVIILIGLALSVYGALNYQNMLSRAGSNDYTSFDVQQIKEGQEIPVFCDSSGNCETQSLDVKLQIKDLEKLAE